MVSHRIQLREKGMNTKTALVAMALLFSVGCAASDTHTLSASSADSPFESHWKAAAQKHDVDPLDLCSIALQESRRHRPDGYLRAWPWTLHTPTEGAMYFSDYESALAKLEQLIAQGLSNIDVGFMQVNWGHHKQRVAGLPAELLKPARNIDVAAKILRENLDATGGNLQLAIAWYHNRRPELGFPYAAAVLTIREYLSAANVMVCSRHGPFLGSE